jgi:hypothetical protein
LVMHGITMRHELPQISRIDSILPIRFDAPLIIYE